MPLVRWVRVCTRRPRTLVVVCLLALLNAAILLRGPSVNWFEGGPAQGWLGGLRQAWEEARTLEVETPAEFLRRYTDYCERDLEGGEEGGRVGNMGSLVCPCVPDALGK